MPISTCIFVNPTYFGWGFQLFFFSQKLLHFLLGSVPYTEIEISHFKIVLLLISVDFHTDRCLNWELQCLMSSTIISLHTSVVAKTNRNFERKCMKIVCVLYCNYFMSITSIVLQNLFNTGPNRAKLDRNAIRKVLNIVCDFRSTLYLEILQGYLVQLCFLIGQYFNYLPRIVTCPLYDHLLTFAVH